MKWTAFVCAAHREFALSESPNDCRLCLAAPQTPQADFPALLAAALDADDVASLVLPAPGPHTRDVIALCIAAAQERGVAALIGNDIEAANVLGADGVHLIADAEAFALARGLLGPSAIIGVDCARSRHDALTFAEKGADYIAFSGSSPEQMEELVSWWADTVVVPCVVWDVASPEDARRFAGAGADFISAGPSIWSVPADVAARARDFNSAIAPGQDAA